MSDVARDEDIAKIEELTNAVEKTKEELINWSLKCDQDGDTAIHLAIIQENADLCLYLCRLLASSGISLDVRNKIMQTPLHLACITGEARVVSGILELQSSSAECTDRNGNTCLHLAARYDNAYSDTLRIVINGINAEENCEDLVNSQNIHGRSALHVASSFNRPEAIKLLVAHGAEINQPETKSGKSPLYLAVQEKHAEAVQALLELGADANKVTYFRDSPSQLASSHDRRSMLRLISRFDTESQSQSPSPSCRRDSREASHMVNQRNFQNASPRLLTIPIMASGDEAAPRNGDAFRQNVIVKNSPLKSTKDTITAVPSIINEKRLIPVKSERLSPKVSSPPAYPASSESQAERSKEKSTSVSIGSSLKRQPDLLEISRAREQLLRTAGSFSRIQSGDFSAPNSFPASMMPALAQERLGVRNIFEPTGLFLPHGATGIRQHLARGLHDRKNEEKFVPTAQDIWLPRTPFGYQHAVVAGYPGHSRPTDSMVANGMGGPETGCVTSKASPSETVSIRKHEAITSSSEPLDLSQSRQHESTEPGLCYRDESRYRTESQSNMLIEDGKMNVRCEDSVTKGTPVSEYASRGDARKSVKTEIASSEGTVDNKSYTERSQLSEDDLASKRPTLLPPYLSLQQLVYDRTLRESLASYGAAWPDLQGAIINSHTFLPHAPFGYLPAAIAAKTPLQALASLDPNNLAQQNLWMVSMGAACAAEKLRSSPVPSKDSVQPPLRKRKSEEGVGGRKTSTEVNSSKAEPKSSADSSKRIKLHESLSEGLQRSVSDDPGNYQHKDSPGNSKKGLERRNSAPSSSIVVSQMLKQEDQKRITPVDLHSYTGCLPPHYLHLLQSSGNLQTTWREHTLRDITELYDGKRKFLAPETAQNALTRAVAAKDRPEKDRNPDISGLTQSQRDEARRLDPQAFLRKHIANSTTNHSDIWRPGITDERDPLVGRMGLDRRDNLSRKDLHTSRRTYTVTPALKEEEQRSLRNARKDTSSNLRDARQASERERKASETESDDEDYIQTLQISDASSDEEEDYGTSRRQNDPFSKGGTVHALNPSSNISFGCGAWRKMDIGDLPAFGGVSITRENTSTAQLSMPYETNVLLSTPTKMADTVRSAGPPPVSGLSRVYCATSIPKSTSKLNGSNKVIAGEFLLHEATRTPEKHADVIAPRLLQLRCVGGSENHKCPGCQHVKEKQSAGGFRDEETRRLIRDILRESFKSQKQNRSVSTVPSSQPRLVFSSDFQSHYGVRPTAVGCKDEGHSLTRRGVRRNKNESTTSSEAYTHKMFNASRATKDRKQHTLAQPTVSKSEAWNAKTVSGRERVVAPFVNGTVASKRRVSSSATGANRLNSLDAKLEELRQKAEANEASAEKRARDKNRDSLASSPVRNSDGTRRSDQENIIPSTIKTESTVDDKREVYSPKSPHRPVLQQHMAALEPRHRQVILSPFNEEENGQFSTKRNSAVTKPNQSLTERYHKEEKLPEYVCPPKKRHFKRYSPEFYNHVKRESSPHNREVRSASPVTRTPFVTTNLLARDEPPRNIRWGSPDRSRRRGSPDSRRRNTPSPRSMLACHLGLQKNRQKPYRASGGLVVGLEQNLLKSTRYATSPRTDAVIVVAARPPAGDERDERLEIGDLEISDDES